MEEVLWAGLLKSLTPKQAEGLVWEAGSVAAAYEGWRESLGLPHPERLQEELAGQGISLSLRGSPGYPSLLGQIPDPPRLLYTRGNWPSGPTVAVVGTRQASLRGREFAFGLGRELVRVGLVVVSGLARGIDQAAHRGALAGNGETVAVLGSGLDRIYPPEHQSLAQEISTRGLVLSEYPPEQAPARWQFPARNRIISGLSLVTVVVEAPERSGALITADLALEQGREVLVVPGPPGHPGTRGVHRLLREGAGICEGIDDILQVLGLQRV